MLPRADWKQHVDALEQLVTEINSPSFYSEKLKLQLFEIFGNCEIAQGWLDTREIALVEFCFYKAEGPYSANFDYFTDILLKVFTFAPKMRTMLNNTADAAIANMILGARGKLKFEISDYYELKIVLDHWAKMGLRPRSVRSVFEALMQKNVVRIDLKNKNVYLLARLKQIFPFYNKEYLPDGLDLDTAIFELQKSRFNVIISYYEKQKLTIRQMIEKENKRVMPAGMSRNNFLSYLLKCYHNYECQLCKLLGSLGQPEQIQVHHIVPLELGGEDHSSNMIVLCKKHHNEAIQVIW